ncbi:helix-turn-helix domain-containing protein [Gorillibacterium sp. sgz5001074]|uniref:helix-turn-helix domain-containing protein n=1 Tax=Gorillibacterium sp. sgz5001074 TaxID=3446695 RepID=UPI003F680ED5
MGDDIHLDHGEGTFMVNHWKVQSHHMPTSHFHSTYEVYCLMSGQRTFFIKDRTVVIQEGDVVIIAPNVLHRTTNAEIPEHERLIVNIDKNYMTMMDAHRDILRPLYEKEVLIVRASPQDKLAISSLTGSILKEIQDRKAGYELFTHTLVMQLLVICCRYELQHSLEPLESLSPMHERISEVVRYINTHYMEELPLPLLAEKFYVSPSYLSRFFKEATGFTFVEYVNSVRVTEAKKLLESTKLQAALIGKKVGFGSVTHFGRIFKSVTGHAPLYYRKARF